MLSYIFVVAVLNIVLGFAVAMHIGRRCCAAVAADDVALATADRFVTDDFHALPEEQTDSVDESVVLPEPEKSESEESVEALQGEVDWYNDKLASTDEQLRPMAETADADTVEECLNSLRKATDEYLDNRNAACEKFDELHNERSEFDNVRNNLQDAVEQEDEQIKATGKTINAFDYEGELEEGVRQMVDETGKLLDVNRQLRDSVDEASVEVAKSENRIVEIDQEKCRDALTGIYNRAGLETKLLKWWEGDLKRERPLSIAMIDIDHFAQIGQQYGQKVGDQILQAVAGLFETNSSENDIVGRFSGQQFAFIFPDVDTEQATNVIERIRQTVEKSQFRYNDNDIRITISCAVMKVTPEDTWKTLVTRMETTIQEAKRYGRNQTFLYENEYPTPVVPPNFELEERPIAL